MNSHMILRNTGCPVPRVKILIAILLLFFMPVCVPAADLVIGNLNCEYRSEPRGIDILQPRLGWDLQTRALTRGLRQSAYQVLVASTATLLATNNADLWNSGRIESGKTSQLVYIGKTLISRQVCFWKVRVWDQDGNPSAWSPVASWTMGLLQAADITGRWIGSPEGSSVKPYELPVPGKKVQQFALPTPRYIRKDFPVLNPVKRATLYTTALGLYEVRINGQKIGNQLLAPEWTNYHKRVQLMTTDVTPVINKGTNAIGAIVGNGWYCGNFQFWPIRNRLYGDRPWFYCQLEIEFANGKKQVINSDSGWKVTTDGPLRQSGIYEGETYDAGKSKIGWDKPGYGDAAWLPAEEQAVMPDAPKFVWQRNEPIRQTGELPARLVSKLNDSTYIYDLGQNISGWVRFSASGTKGQHVRLRHAEALLENGQLWREGLRDAQAEENYTFAGSGTETFEPHFTYHGFRYVEVCGIRKEINIKGINFRSDLALAGRFSCSDSNITRLAESIRWSMDANFMGIPTDCPNRDERTGVTGDHQFFMPTAMYNRNASAFFSKWLVDLCEDSRMPAGNFADIAPFYGIFGEYTQGWGDAGIICPYYQYKQYNDVRVIEEHYDAMKAHFAYVEKNSKDYIAVPVRQSSPGDWLNNGGTATTEVMGTAYFAWMAGMMQEMAAAIGKSAEASTYAALKENIRRTFVTNFVDKEGRIKNSSQTAYAMAFNMDLVPDSLFGRMASQFEKEIIRFDHHPAVGFMGVPHLLPGLHKAGLDKLAYKVLLQDSYPSWLYMIRSDHSTAIWERWDSWTKEKGFHEGMNSLNHVVWGSVGEYLFREIGGIRSLENGFSMIGIEPVIQDGIAWAKTSYKSISGSIETSWKKTVDGFDLEITIPPNAGAILSLKLKAGAVVTEGKKPIQEAIGISDIKLVAGKLTASLLSGKYSFHVLEKAVN